MTRQIVFNGITYVHPGAASKIDARGLAQVTNVPTGIVALIGEASGGQPNEVSASGDPNEGVPKVYSFSDPEDAIDVFRSGDLADAIRLAFQGANDPRINFGANKVIAIKTNQSTASEATLSENVTPANDAIHLRSIDYGAHTAGISVEISTNAADDDKIDVVITDMDERSEYFTGICGTPLLDVQYKGPDTPTLVKSYTTTAGSTDVELVDTSVDFTADGVEIGNWVIITGGTATPDDIFQVRRISGVAATVLTVDYNFLDSGGSAVNSASGWTFDVVKEVVGTFAVGAYVAGTPSLEISATPKPIQTAASLVYATVHGAGGSAFFGDGNNGPDYVRVVSGPGAGQIIEIASASAATGNLVVTLATTPAVALTTNSRVMFLNVLNKGGTAGAVATVTGTAGAATQLQTSVVPGLGEVGAGVLTTDLTISLVNGSGNPYTVADLISFIKKPITRNWSSTPNGYTARAGSSRASNLTVDRLDFDGTNTGVKICVGYDVAFSGTFGDSPVKQHRLLDNCALLVDAINSRSSKISAKRLTSSATDGRGVPVLDGAVTLLTGGSLGVTSALDLINAFDQLIKHRHNIVVPLWSADTGTMSLAAVHQATLSHVQTGEGAGKNENAAILAIDVSVDTEPNSNASALEQVLSAQAAINNHNVALTPFRVRRAGVDGVVKTMKAHMMAVVLAGADAGAPIGEPLTFKYIQADDVEYPIQLDPLDRSVSDTLLLNGILFVEPVEGKGFRVVKDISTHTKDDNLGFTDRNVRKILNEMSYQLRTGIQNEFTGLRGTPASANRIKDWVIDKLDTFKDQEWIVDSTDPITGERQNAWMNLRVKISGDIASVRVEVFPAIGISYATITIFPQIPTIVAS